MSGFLRAASQIAVAQSAVASATLTGTLAESNIVAPIAVPAGTLGANGQLEIEALFTFAGTHAKTVLIYFGSTIYFQQTYTGTGSLRVRVALGNRNSAASQIGRSKTTEGEGLGVAAQVTGTENTANAISVSINGTLADITDSIVLEMYRITAFPKA